jgi:anaerobic selenocysteine-containing dehydrogenase
MKKEKNKNQSFVNGFLADYVLTRRSFMKKATAATGTAVALGGLKPSLKALAAAGEDSADQMGQWIASTCQGCTSWCSHQVYVVNGRAVKVRGNPNSKVNGTAGCPRSHLALQQVYDPDRIKTPMKRTNPKKGRKEDPVIPTCGMFSMTA